MIDLKDHAENLERHKQEILAFHGRVRAYLEDLDLAISNSHPLDLCEDDLQILAYIWLHLFARVRSKLQRQQKVLKARHQRLSNQAVDQSVALPWRLGKPELL